MSVSSEFLCGVIEGFYGRDWSFETRLSYADHLARAGLNTCIYCPKGDPFLRKRWTRQFPDTQWRQLSRLSSHYRERGIQWGVGLSPFALYRNYSGTKRRQLRRKLARLAELEAPLMALLFDDMPGNLDALASLQAEIVSDVCAWMPGVRLLVCPTYYSFDPALETHFGRMPVDYWPQLGRELPPQVDVFWTGNRVCPETIGAADILAIERLLGRRILLWDNYPVNDGATRSNFLYTSKLSGRDPALAGLVGGHLCNPMNQGLLSLPALGGLAELYGGPGFDDDYLGQVLGTATLAQLARDGEVFERSGLSGLGPAQCVKMAASYGALPGPAAREVADWLRGEYAFDPACLTD